MDSEPWRLLLSPCLLSISFIRQVQSGQQFCSLSRLIANSRTIYCYSFVSVSVMFLVVFCCFCLYCFVLVVTYPLENSESFLSLLLQNSIYTASGDCVSFWQIQHFLPDSSAGFQSKLIEKYPLKLYEIHQLLEYGFFQITQHYF